jgi:hypothetical protein
MGLKRLPILEPEIEEKLKADLEPLWTEGLTAQQIAERLEFGLVDGKYKGNYKKLIPAHVWYYREKFEKELKKQGIVGFKRRKKGIKKGKHRYHAKRNTIMTLQEFEETINKQLPYSDDPEVRMKRAYLILSFWCPLRKSEIIERLRKDFKIESGALKIDLYRKKKRYPDNAESEPFYLPLTTPMLNEVTEWIFKFKKDERPFNFDGWYAWHYVKDVFGLYPHYFRFDWVTKAIQNADNVAAIIPELLRDTGMDVQTIMSYIMKNPKYRTSITDRDLDILRAAGVDIPKDIKVSTFGHP